MKLNALAEAKTELLCWGLKPTGESTKAYFEQNPSFGHKTGNVGLNLILDNKTVVLVNTRENFCKNSPYEIKKKENWELYKNGKFVCDITIIKMPQWYNLKTSSGRPMTDIFLHEGKNYLHESYKGCGYFAIGEECKFCAAGSEIKHFNPKEIAEVVNTAAKENKNYQVCLSGGTLLSPDRSANIFIEEIKEIRKVSKVPIFVELAPPGDNAYLQKLINAGGNTFSMNMEIWEDKIRKETCPGKSKIPKARYFEAHQYVFEKLGTGSTNTVFIGGLEPKESLLEGVEEFLKIGTSVDLMPFKPWGGSKFEDKPPADPYFIIDAENEITKLMKKYKTDKTKACGCPNCGGCSPEQDFFKAI